MNVISVVNYKGGVGKTTLISNIAAKLSSEGKKVLLIDLDPQGSLTFSFMHTDEWSKKYSNSKTIKNWFDGKLNDKDVNLDDYVINDLYINRKYLRNNSLDLIASHLGLYDISMEMAIKLGGRGRRNISKNKNDCLFMLKRGLKDIGNKYDYVFIDCQPSFDLLTQNAIVASDYYIIPTKFDYLSTLGIDSLIFHIENLIKEIGEASKEFSFKGYNLNPKLLGVVGNMVTISKENNMINFNENILNEFKKDKYKLFKSRIRNNPEFMDSKELIPAIMKKSNSSNKTREKIKAEIEAVTLEFKERI
ncbi:chromosome partitioning protein [Clostridium sp. DSM 8431]|uniref:ParA family protein n=1 Tax=Clostridium sp. DSM 8431 TaxID=1761781 RepID=UPI0008F21E0B|nr:AAA family ATPase [Clostridium sp. DSM 8431]SFU41501.1 chromosome partitioning protein [Clostridium sp. DSM 8431]